MAAVCFVNFCRSLLKRHSILIEVFLCKYIHFDIFIVLPLFTYLLICLEEWHN